MKSPKLRQIAKKILQDSAADALHSKRKQNLPWKSSVGAALLKKNAGNGSDSLFFRKKSVPDNLDKMDDSELITFIHTKNKEAYKELFARYQKKLFTYIYHLVGNREETEDILQNVFSKTYRNIEHFDVSRKFSSWIYRIAHNEAVNFLKRKSKRYTVSWEDIATSKDKLDSASNEELPEDRIGHKEIVQEIDSAMEKLPPKYQQVLKLRYFQEYSYEEIGKILGKPLNTVGTLINRAKKKLLEVVKKSEKK
ncbi:MAG: RNA polymerase sigma factor [Candidatus Moranbacteria bacterium]|nr:RNA polymerase sigma factor [Candidatus Moranbacteria bacterium]